MAFALVYVLVGFVVLLALAGKSAIKDLILGIVSVLLWPLGVVAAVSYQIKWQKREQQRQRRIGQQVLAGKDAPEFLKWNGFA